MSPRMTDDTSVPSAPRYDPFSFSIFILVALGIVQQFLVKGWGYNKKFGSI